MAIRFALSAININQCWQIVPFYKEILKRGHHADVFASVHNSSSFIPLNLENIPWEAIETATPEDLQKNPYDIVIESDRALSDVGLKKTGFSIGYFPGGCGHWITTGDNLPAMARHTLWIGHNRFEQESRIIQGHSGVFPIIGMPSLSNYKGYQKKTSKILKGLYLNGPPFGPENKKRFTHFLSELAKKNPHIEIHIKERFLGKDISNHFELEVLKLDSMPNVHVYDGYASAVELVKEVDFMVGFATTAFLESLFIKKPVFIPSDLDTELLNGVRTGVIYPQVQEGLTHVGSKKLIEQFDACYAKAHQLSLEGYLTNFPDPDPCKTIIDIAETIHHAKEGRSIDSMNICLPYEGPRQFEHAIKQWMHRMDKEPAKLYEEREENLYLMTVFSEVIRHVRYIVPNLPHEIYQRFTAVFKKEYAQNKGNAEWQVGVFEQIGSIFYNYLRGCYGIQEAWFPSKGTLFDVYSKKYIEEAIRLIPSFKEAYDKLC